MAEDFQSILESPIYQVHIKSTSGVTTDIAVHGQAIARLSAPLKAMIRGGWKESETRKIMLSGVTADTFQRVCHFAYTGNYAAAEHAIELLDNGDAQTCTSPIGPAEEEPQPATDLNYRWGTRSPISSFEAERSTLRSKFDKRSFDGLQAPPCYEVRGNLDSKEDYRPVFYAHGRVYLFAVQWQIPSLRALALSKVHATLKAFSLYHNRVKDIVSLAQLLYQGDEATGEVSAPDGDEMRELVCEFLACEVKTVFRCAEYRNLLEAEGPFAIEQLDMLVAEMV